MRAAIRHRAASVPRWSYAYPFAMNAQPEALRPRHPAGWRRRRRFREAVQLGRADSAAHHVAQLTHLHTNLPMGVARKGEAHAFGTPATRSQQLGGPLAGRSASFRFAPTRLARGIGLTNGRRRRQPAGVPACAVRTLGAGVAVPPAARTWRRGRRMTTVVPARRDAGSPRAWHGERDPAAAPARLRSDRDRRRSNQGPRTMSRAQSATRRPAHDQPRNRITARSIVVRLRRRSAASRSSSVAGSLVGGSIVPMTISQKLTVSIT